MFFAFSFTESKRKLTAEASLSVDNHCRGKKHVVSLELAGLRNEQDGPGSQRVLVRNLSRIVQSVQELLRKASLPISSCCLHSLTLRACTVSRMR